METRSIRDRSGVGRFPAVALGFGDDTEEEKEEKEENDDKKENGCRRWLRKVCPCCCRRPSDDEVTDTLVTGIDDPEKGEETDGEKPATGGSELDGNWHLGELTIAFIKQSSHVIDHLAHVSVFVSRRTPPESEIDRPDEKQIRAEPHGAPHRSLPK